MVKSIQELDEKVKLLTPGAGDTIDHVAFINIPVGILSGLIFILFAIMTYLAISLSTIKKKFNLIISIQNAQQS
jgi:hypothetical protein